MVMRVQFSYSPLVRGSWQELMSAQKASLACSGRQVFGGRHRSNLKASNDFIWLLWLVTHARRKYIFTSVHLNSSFHFEGLFSLIYCYGRVDYRSFTVFWGLKALPLVNPTELEIFYCDLGAKALLLGIRSELNFTIIWGQKPSRFFWKLCPDAL